MSDPEGVAAPEPVPPDRTFTDVFEASRARLAGLAYRITGSRLDAEDIVQEAWLRAQRAGTGSIERPEAWLTTVVSRLALDDLRSARRRREEYIGPWLPEPVRAGPGPDRTPGPGGSGSSGRPGSWTPGGAGLDPAAAAELAESLTNGFLRVLDTLSPVERVVFLLADVFETPYAEIGVIVDRSPEACRQLAHRARGRVRAGQVRHDRPEDATRVVEDLLEAVASGDVDRVLRLLAGNVVLTSDGGEAARAARRPVRGPDRVARFLVNLTRRILEAGVEGEPAYLNGEPAWVLRLEGQVVGTLAVHVLEGSVRALHVMRNPDKLAALDLDTPLL